MEISEVRIKLVANSSERLRAFCSVTLDGDFVIRDLKIIEGVSGVFVAMPSRKLADRCPRCGCKNHLRARYCNDCGAHLRENRAPKDAQGRAKLHADIAHPINAGCRERIQNAVVEAYEAELERSKSPDYKPQNFDDFDDYDVDFSEEAETVGGSRKSVQNESSGDAASGEFHDYNDLIADLKRDAAERRQEVSSRSSEVPEPSRLPPVEGESPVGKPAYRHARRPAEVAEARAGNPQSQRHEADALRPDASDDEDDAFGAGLL